MDSPNSGNASNVLRTVEIARRHLDRNANPITSLWVDSLHNELSQLDEAGLPFSVDNLTASLVNMMIRVETEFYNPTLRDEGSRGQA